MGVAEQMKISNTVSFSLTGGQPYNTGLKKAGIYKWLFSSVNYASPLYFILTVSNASYGILKLNEPWYSSNVILSIDSTTYGSVNLRCSSRKSRQRKPLPREWLGRRSENEKCHSKL